MVRRSIPSPGDAQTNPPLLSCQLRTYSTETTWNFSTSPTPRSARQPSHISDGDRTMAFNPDIPLPSIEGDSNQDPALTTLPHTQHHDRYPSVAITPPTSAGDVSPTPCSSISYGGTLTPTSTIASLNQDVADLEISNAPLFATDPVDMHGSSLEDPFGHSPITITTSSNDRISTRSPTIDGMANAMAFVTLRSPPSLSGQSTPTGRLNPPSPSPGTHSRDTTASPGPGSRRRSSSNFDQTPHQVADEEPPHERFHDPEFQRALTNAKGLMRNLANILASSSLHHEAESRIRPLHSQAVDLTGYQNPATRVVGLVGDSGVGKSSVLNSLLDLEGFARTSNSGAACTCVVTEYYHNEQSGFALEVEYFTLDELRKQLQELLQSYRRYHLAEPNGDEMSLEEKQNLENKANVAHDTFYAAFRDRLLENDPSLLQEAENVVLQRLLSWARMSGLPLQENTSDVVTREVFTTSASCSDRLTHLTSEPSFSTQASTWPFIRKIKVYINSFILSKGLILVDLPGLRDLNSARLLITEKYLLNCHEIFAVCQIGRATTDAGVAAVFDLARRASLLNVGIICTKSDDIQADEAQRDWIGNSRTMIVNMLGEIAHEQENLNSIEDRINDLGDESDMTDGEGYGDEKEALLLLHAAARKSRKRLIKRRFELKKYLINTRNQKVTSALQATSRQRYSAATLPIFCISNVEYWEHRKEPKAVALPSLQLSGILEVRKYCLSVVAESQLIAATEYMVNSVPAFLGSVELWVQSGLGSASAERKQAIRDTVRAIERELDNLTLPTCSVSTAGRSIELKFKERISRPMREYSEQWSHDAQSATRAWQGWHHSTYSAFCRNFGDHVTAAAGSRCWNDEAIQKMVSQMSGPWQRLRQEVQELQEDMSEEVKRVFDRAITLSGSNGGQRSALRTLTATLRHRQALLLSIVGKLGEDFQGNLDVLKIHAITGIRSSGVGEIMEPSYRASQLEGGTGSDMRRKRIIANGFGSCQLFPAIRRNLSARLSPLLDNLDTKIQEAVNTHLEAVQRDLDTLKNENVALESERNPIFRERLGQAVAEIRDKMADVHAAIRED